MRIKRLLLPVMSLVIVISTPATANAISSIFPDSATSSVNETVAVSSYTTSRSTVWGLDTGVNEYKVFVRTTNTSDTITIEYACEGVPHRDHDEGGRDYEHANGVSQTRWYLMRTDRDENPTTVVPRGIINSYDASCNGGNITQSFTASGSPTSTVPGHGRYHVYVVRVQEINTEGDDGAGKGFKIRSQWASSLVTPSELNYASPEVNSVAYPAGLPFALIDGIRSNSRPDSTYRFQFSPDCRYPNNTLAYIKWYDADIGINQDEGMEMRLLKDGVAVPLQAYKTDPGRTPRGTNTPIDENGTQNGSVGNNNTVLRRLELMGGNNISGAYGVASFTATHNAIYEVQWTGVNNSNALQFWMPFSELNATLICPPPPPGYDINDPTPSGVSTGRPNDNIKVNFNYVNVGDGPTPSPSNLRIFIDYSNTYIKGSPTSVTANNFRPIIAANNDWNTDDGGGVEIQIPNNAQVGNQYCVRSRARPQHGRSDGSDFNANLGITTAIREHCVRVIDEPYLQVYGNDVWSGAGFDLSLNGDSGCSSSFTGKNIDDFGVIKSNIRSNVGAMSEYAAYAWGVVAGFGTASNAGGNTLTFANTPSNGLFGAERCLEKIFDSGGAGGAINDLLWGEAASLGVSLNSLNPSTESGQYKLGNESGTSNTTHGFNNSALNGVATNSLNGTITMLVNGNAHIQRNITARTTGLAQGDVPLLVLIATGNIHIDPDVTRLDGVFISAQTIDTCATGTVNGTFNEDLAVDTECDNHLEINGTFIANNIAFRRTFGGTNEAATGSGLDRCMPNNFGGFYNSFSRRCAAETFRFPPAFYLADIILDYGDDESPIDLPIQQIRDLPPVY